MIIEKKIKQQKTTSINEMAFVASTGASTGLITPAISISDIKYLSSAYKNSLKTVEIGGVEPPRLGVISPASQPAIPTAGLLYDKNLENKNQNSVLIAGLIILAVVAGVYFLIKNQASVKLPSPPASAVPSIPEQKIPLTWTDENQNEDFIIRSDRKTYYGLNQAEVYFSLTSQSRKNQQVSIYFWFDGHDKSVASVQKIDGQNKIPLTVAADFPAPQSAKRKDIKNYTAGDKVEDSIKAGQTNYYKAVIAYPADSRGEFFIEAFGDQGGYGLLDPYYDSGLVGYWSFNGPDVDYKTNTAYDRSGSANNGTMTNMSTTTSSAIGISGQALSFDGSNNFVRVSSPSNLPTGDFSISFWANVTSPDDGSTIDVPFSIGNGASEELSIYIEEIGRVRVVTNGALLLNSATTIATSTWTQVTVRRSGSAVTVYFNGVQDANSGTDGTAFNFGSCSLFWGAITNVACTGTSAGFYFKGRLDEARVYNRALSADEITALYNTDKARLKIRTTTNKIKLGTSIAGYVASGLVGNWTFNGPDMAIADPIIAYDRSGQTNNATSTGASIPLRVIGKIGQALSFDKANSVVSSAPSSSLNALGAITVSAWVFPKSIGESNQGQIVCKCVDPAPINGWHLDLSLTTNFQFEVDYLTTDVGLVSTGNPVILNQWQQVAATWSGGTTGSTAISLYYNGQLVSAVSSSNGTGGRVTDVNSRLWIGNDDQALATFDGLIDDVRVYNKALNASEILDLYNLGLRRVKPRK